jgi:hypothetical protein
MSDTNSLCYSIDRYIIVHATMSDSMRAQTSPSCLLL